ncbi:recombinase family protein [Shinella sp. PSBB067]|uniref:recombinase family protein n=1 Tax=Shinella sp. PSBB067 TaxID=2715959 RepID=UPI00193BA113|nr:recombinase family protein [Shinella sp. PSBB067]QRI65816.1 recombinase family protein [Shinella sp. PSBB067]
MRIGYARVSTEDQKLDMQLQALRHAGCDRIFTDHGISGKVIERPGLDEALASLSPDDTLVVWRLDRLGRSLVHLVQLMNELGERAIHFHSLAENIDTGSSGGRLLFHMIAALAEFERSLISERTRAGMAAARERGQRLGRPPALNAEELREAIEAVRGRGEYMGDVALRYRITRRTLRRMILEADRVTAG